MTIKTVSYRSLQSGPTFTVLGAVHGNEPCGAAAINRLIADLDRGEAALAKGELQLVPVCNPRAYAEKVRFVERNCLQCGLCQQTCPENAISLQPRLLLTPQAREPVTLNEEEPFPCVRCAKPFGTRSMIERMSAKLAGHSMFGGDGLRRLQMCADCRVIDMMEAKNTQQDPLILDIPPSGKRTPS